MLSGGTGTNDEYGITVDSSNTDASDVMVIGRMSDYTVDGNDLVINSSGNAGIGTTGPSTLLHVSSTGSPTLTIDSTSSAGTRQAWLKLNVNNSGSSDPAGAINFSAADIEQARIDSITR